LSRDERNLRDTMASRRSTIDAGVRGYDAEREQRAEARRARIESLRGVGEKMAARGKAVTGTGKAMFGMLSEPIDASKQAESETLRIRAMGASADAVKFARAQQAYGQSTIDNLTLMREALAEVGGDEARAKVTLPLLADMKFANESLYGKDEGKKNVEKFMSMMKVIDLRGGTKDKAAFDAEANIVQKMMTVTGAKVSGDEWGKFADEGGNAAKKLRTDAFYYQMQPLIERLGGKAAGQGLAALFKSKTSAPAVRQLTELGLVDPKLVEHKKNGAISGLKPGALTGSDMLQASPLEWLEKVLLPKLAAKGITDPEKIKDTIAKLFPDQAAGKLLTTMYDQREQIHDTEKQAAATDGIGAMKAKGMESTQGRELAMYAQLRDLKLEIGERVTPIYNKALEITATAIGKVVAFMREHRTAANVIVTTLTVLAGLFVAVGTLASMFGAVLGSIAMVRFAMSIVSALNMIRVAIMTNPLLFFLGVLAAVAMYVWQHWDTIGPSVIGACEKIKGAFGKAVDWMVAKWNATIKWVMGAVGGIGKWFSGIGTGLMDIGSGMITALIDGITNRLGALKDTIGNLGTSALGWLREKLGLKASDTPGDGAAGDAAAGPGRVARTAGT
ncbi:hypothetical protein G3N57_32425, partial [Paraburkholderia sp. Se-20369]|nr:hypothetical protein [Paraburkholderia sp. Se-20369]